VGPSIAPWRGGRRSGLCELAGHIGRDGRKSPAHGVGWRVEAMWRDGSGAGDVAHVIKHVLYTPEPSAKVKSPPSLLIFGWTRLFFLGQHRPTRSWPEIMTGCGISFFGASIFSGPSLDLCRSG
jgi:hypothetical protein